MYCVLNVLSIFYHKYRSGNTEIHINLIFNRILLIIKLYSIVILHIYQIRQIRQIMCINNNVLIIIIIVMIIIIVILGGTNEYVISDNLLFINICFT